MKKKNVKGSQRERSGTHKMKPIKITVEISLQKSYKLEDLGTNIQHSIEKNFRPRISYSTKLSFISEGKIKSLGPGAVADAYNPSTLVG